jgi:UDP-galactopyranose mutase
MTEFLSLKSSSSQISESTTHEATDNIKSDSRQHQKEQQPHLRSSSRDSATDNERPFYDDEYDVCVVGAGLSGAVIAERYSSQLQQKVLIVEKRNHIGGNCYDYIDDDTGIRVSKYGAHLFHTIHDKVWQYVQQFSQWTKFEHEVVGIVDGKYVPIPVNINTVNMLFNLSISSVEEMDEWLKSEQIHYDHEPTNSEEMALSRVGPRLFKSIFEPYTIKQWAKHPRELGPEVTAR